MADLLSQPFFFFHFIGQVEIVPQALLIISDDCWKFNESNDEESKDETQPNYHFTALKKQASTDPSNKSRRYGSTS